MDLTASPTLIAATVAVVLGGLGLVGGLVGYVQGAAALRRSTLARQRAASAEESALQAKTQADASARAAERALDRLRDMGVDPELLRTGPVRLQMAPDEVVDGSDRADPPAEESEPPMRKEGPAWQEHPAREEAPAQEEAPAEETRLPPAERPAQDEVPAEPTRSGVESSSTSQADEPASAAAEVAPNARSAGGQVVAGEQEAPPLDWEEALRTGSVPLPARSRGTYAAPARARSASEPTPAQIRFEMRAVGRQRWEAVNVGDVEAEGATVEGLGDDRHLVRPATGVPALVAPGGVLALSAPRVDGRRLQVRVRWTEGGEAAVQDLLLS